jgi:hypothetical protein
MVEASGPDANLTSGLNPVKVILEVAISVPLLVLALFEGLLVCMIRRRKTPKDQPVPGAPP